MANRFPLVLDTTDNNKIKEIQNGDNLDLTGNSVVGVQNITANGTIDAADIKVNGSRLVAQSFADLTDTPNNFIGAPNYFVKVKADGTGLEFRPLSDLGNIEIDTITVDTGIVPSVNGVGNIGGSTSKFDSVYSTKLYGSLYSYNEEKVFDSITGKISYAALQGAPEFISEFTNDVGYLRTADLDTSLASLFDEGVPFNTDIVGSVFGDDSTVLIDGVSSLVTGDVLNTSVDTSAITSSLITTTTIASSVVEGPASGNLEIDAGASGIIEVGFSQATREVRIENAVLEAFSQGSDLGIAEIVANTDLTISAGNRISIHGRVPFRFSSTTTLEQSAIAALEGDVIYNEDTNRLQMYQGGTWKDVNGNVEATAGTSNFNDVIVAGDLTVQGTTTSIETTNTEITDNTILLNKGEAGAGVTNLSAGIEIDRGSEANVSFIWDESIDRWSIGAREFTASGLYSTSVTGTGFGDITNYSNVTGTNNGSVSGFLNVTGTNAGTVSGFASVTGTTLGDITQFRNVTGTTVGSVTGFINVTGTDTGDVSGFVNVTGTDTGDITGYRHITGTTGGNITDFVGMFGTGTGNIESFVNITGTDGGSITRFINITGTSTGTISGFALQGNLTGNVTGNVAGNVTGNVSGNIDNTSLTIGASNATSIAIGNAGSTTTINGTFQIPALIAGEITADDSISITTATGDGNAISIGPGGTNTFINFTADNIRFFGPVTSGITGDLKGSVVGDDSTILVDGVNSKIVGDITSTNIDGQAIKADTIDNNTGTTLDITADGFLNLFGGDNDAGVSNIQMDKNGINHIELKTEPANPADPNDYARIAINANGAAGDVRIGTPVSSRGQVVEIYNAELYSPNFVGSIIGDLQGSVFADDSTLLVDAVNGSIPWSVITGFTGGAGESYTKFGTSTTENTGITQVGAGSYFVDEAGTNDVEVLFTVTSGYTNALVTLNAQIRNITDGNSAADVDLERSINGGAYTKIQTFKFPAANSYGAAMTFSIIDAHGAGAGDTVSYKLKNGMVDNMRLVTGTCGDTFGFKELP